MSSASKNSTSGEGDAFFKLGEHQFLAMFEVEKVQPDRTRGRQRAASKG